MVNEKKLRKKTTRKAGNLDKLLDIFKTVVEGFEVVKDIRNQEQSAVPSPNIKEAKVTKLDPYAILAVPRDVPEEVCKSRFRALVKIYHPDRGGTKEKFKEINEAYESIKKQKGWT